ncbi:MAG: hypothetical protein U9Q74_03135 [Gemmatimonadota bacterium]|nr:hypothetical protein [Gemmatimonadota bacterium]
MMPTWAAMPRTARVLAAWVVIVLAVGYTTSLVFVYHTTGLTPGGAAERYRGTDAVGATGGTPADAPMQFPKPLGEMLLSTHTHVLTMAMIFVITGAGLVLCEWPSERWRRWLIGEPFAAILVSFASIWLMRYVDPRWAWLLFASSTLMAVTFYAQVIIILGALRRAGRS